MLQWLTYWKKALLDSVLLTLLVIVLFRYFFVTADREIIFLYYHLDWVPWDAVTQSRHWMTSLVVSGVVLIAEFFLLSINMLQKKDLPPAWFISLLTTIPSAVAVYYITSQMGESPLTWEYTLATTIAIILGLNMAIPTAHYLAKKQLKSVLLLPYILALTPLLILLKAVELLEKNSSVTKEQISLILLGVIIVSFCVPLITSLIYHWRKLLSVSPWRIYFVSLSAAYLILPLIHFLFFTPHQARYISTSSNFFANDPLLQIAILFITLLMAGLAEILPHMAGLVPPSSQK